MKKVPTIDNQRRDFHLTVLGRTLEHLGVQMYKRRDVAIAELVANCWDEGASNVWITASESRYCIHDVLPRRWGW